MIKVYMIKVHVHVSNVCIKLLGVASFPLGNTDPTRVENMADITNLLSMRGSPNGTLVSFITLMKSSAGEEEAWLVRL